MPARALEVSAVIAGIPVSIARRSPTAASSPWTDEQRQATAGLAGSVAVDAMVGAHEHTVRSLEATSALEASRWAAAARSLAIVGGILTDKAQLLTGQPTSRAERVDTAELTERLHRLLGLRSGEVLEVTGEG